MEDEQERTLTTGLSHIGLCHLSTCTYYIPLRLMLIIKSCLECWNAFQYLSISPIYTPAVSSQCFVVKQMVLV